jgi:hypothetical protein
VAADESFLRRAAREVLRLAEANAGAGTRDLSSVAVVFANRRAGVFFFRELGEISSGPSWAPGVLTLSEFLRQSAPQLHVPDALELVGLLYREWILLGATEPLEDFVSFGQRLLADFDDLDRNLADPSQVLRNLSDLKALEQWAGVPEESLERLKQFWATFSERPLRIHQANYLAQFDRLLPLYVRFEAALSERGWTTEGKLARSLAHQLKAGEDAALPAKHVLFAGLGALGKAEQSILRILLRRGLATLLPDADTYYTQELEYHEAHTALAPQHTLIGSRRDTPSRIGQQALEIEWVQAALSTGVAHAAGQVLARWHAEGSLEPERTAVVLADEGLLFSVLQQLPAGLGALNVTMGYPLMQTAAARLCRAAVELNSRAWRESNGAVSGYPMGALRALLQHPYVQSADTNGSVASWLRERIAKGWTHVTVDELPSAESAFIRILLQPLAVDSDLISHLRSVLIELNRELNARAEDIPIVDLEAVVALLTELERVHSLRVDYGSPASEASAQWGLLKQVWQRARLPFSGEPLSGLQVMGMLETRALEFDTVMVLSANEGTLPRPTDLHESMLPYSLRQAFGLPTPEQTDAVASYNFYRLLHGAKRLVLITDTVGSEGAAEASRYVLQLRHELAALHPEQVRFTERVAFAPADYTPTPDETIAKTPQMIEAIRKRADPGNPESRGLSPTLLQTYISCPVKFYYQYIEGIDEPDELADTLDARQFGELLHGTLEQLYEPLLGKASTREDLLAQRTRVKAALATATDAMPALRGARTGKNHLLLRVIEELADRVLGHDSELAAEATLTPESIEKPLSRSLRLDTGETIKIAGRADRIDRWGKRRRIVDYKTGAVKEAPARLAAEQLLERMFADDEHKETLQGLLYAWLLDDDVSMRMGEVDVVIYPMQKIASGPLVVTDRGNVLETWPHLEARLRALVGELLDPTVPFIQKKDPKRCGICAYHRLCYGL